jgi:hypothetical protein
MSEEDKQRIRILFAYVVRMLKSNAEMTARVSSELASVTSAVRALDPSFDEVLAHRREGVDEISDPIIHANLDQYDEMIRSIEAGEIV